MRIGCPLFTPYHSVLCLIRNVYSQERRKNMNKDTLSMVKQILMDEESLDQLREKLEHEKNQSFPKKKPCKPEREQVARCYNPVRSQLKPDYAKWCRSLIFTGILFAAGMVLSAIPDRKSTRLNS